MKFYLLTTLLLLLSACAEKGPVRFGVIADCQYCEKPTSGQRHYSESPQKLEKSITHFNELKPEWIIHLGDFIEEKYESFEPLLKITAKSTSPIKHVLGNHDYDVEDKYKADIPTLLKMPAPFYSWSEKGWRFIVVDGNDISVHAHAKDSPKQKEAWRLWKTLKPKQPAWNGALGKEQLAWMRKELTSAQNSDEKVILFCHFPVFPADQHVLWNSQEVLSLIDEFTCVRGWLNGHNHNGDYAERKGVHYVTFRAMVDTEQSAYSIVVVDEEKISIQGFGREESRELIIKKK